MKNKIYIIWIWWIWISWIARYYLQKWWEVHGSDKVWSELIKKLKDEWADILIWEDWDRILSIFKNSSAEQNLLVYTEAVPKTQIELKKARELWIETLTYPEALASIANKKKLITIAWTHWKSTTSSLASLVLKNSEFWVSSLVWTVLKEFDNKNTYFSDSEYFVIEACEYKRSFLKYKPTVAVIVNIDLDHLDYYKDLEDYVSAYEQYINNVVPWWFVIINAEDENCKKLIWLRKDISYIKVYEKIFVHNNTAFMFPNIKMKVPWNHILFDAKLAYIVGHMIWISDESILKTLNNYSWVWRRMEIVWKTKNNNILMSDYWHHPSEIIPTLKAIKGKYWYCRDTIYRVSNKENTVGWDDEDTINLASTKKNKIGWDKEDTINRVSTWSKKLLVIFQPHQYNRTLELLEWFKNCFSDADKLIIPDIYESRDSEEDKQKINPEKLVEYINHPDKQDWKGLENTLKIIQDYDEKNPDSSVILLLWAWNVDDLRKRII